MSFLRHHWLIEYLLRLAHCLNVFSALQLFASLIKRGLHVCYPEAYRYHVMYVFLLPAFFPALHSVRCIAWLHRSSKPGVGYLILGIGSDCTKNDDDSALQKLQREMDRWKMVCSNWRKGRLERRTSVGIMNGLFCFLSHKYLEVATVLTTLKMEGSLSQLLEIHYLP